MTEEGAREMFKSEAVKASKTWEAVVMRVIDEISESGEADMRWLSIARTNIEQGFMALERAIVKPPRFNPQES